MSDGRKAKALVGGYAGGGAPLGYGAQRGSHVLVVEPTQAEAVRQVFALRAQGLSLRGIADDLNAGGVAAHEGGAWHPAQVKRVLDRSAFYRGAYAYGGVRAEHGRQEPIVEVEA